MKLKPIDEWMEEKNTAYYKSPSTKIYDDFSTYAQSEKGMLARANAQAFCKWASENKKNKYNILETGVGNGAFAYAFLDEIRKIDGKSKEKILNKINYTLADFSAPMLEKAKLQNAAFKKFCNINAVLFDASLSDALKSGEISEDTKKLGTYDYIRCNELFSDLPAKLYANIDGEISQVLMDDKMQAELEPLSSSLDDIEAKMILSLPENYFIPINRIAVNSCAFFSSLLNENACMDVFDYGFYFNSDFVIPPDMWNMSIVREYGGQWTIDLNFIYLSLTLSSLGKNIKIERQKDYVQNVIGKKLSISDDSGLDYEETDGEFEEDDSFYHMQIKN
ncbi:MAG: SAM-dependent methyltransferase [Candidatus Micrarchaeia archaeon]